MADYLSEKRRNPDDAGVPILVPVDFSADSEAALIWACRYASCIGAGIVVLHVIHDPAEAPGYYRESDAELLRPMEDVATDMMEKFIEKMRARYPNLDALKGVKRRLVKGIPATRILEVASTTGACLIVMGSRGKTGLPHLLLGSKAERVAQMSPIPVTIVKADMSDD